VDFPWRFSDKTEFWERETGSGYPIAEMGQLEPRSRKMPKDDHERLLKGVSV
jgi:hypothetical protein